MKIIKKTFNFILGLSIILGAIYLLYYVLTNVISFFLKLQSDIAIAIIGAMSTVIVTIITVTIGRYVERKKVIEQELRKQKIPIYEEFIDFFMNVFMSEKIKNKQMSEKEMIEFFNEFTKKLIIWGSDDVIYIWSDYRNNYANNAKAKPKESMVQLEKLLLAIRKDTGHNNKNLKEGDLLGLFINDFHEYTEKKD